MNAFFPIPDGLTVFGEWFFGALWIIGGGAVVVLFLLAFGFWFHWLLIGRPPYR